MNERRRSERPRRRSWRIRASLTVRILAVNIIALGLLAGSLFYLDSYRNRLLAERYGLARAEAELTSAALALATPAERRELMVRIGRTQRLRLRLYDAKGGIAEDSFALAPPSFRFTDPASEPWYQDAARSLDRGMDWLLGAPSITDYREPARDSAAAWNEIGEAKGGNRTAIRQRLAPDRTPVISAATQVGRDGAMLLVTRNAPDITQDVRDARGTLALVVGAALLISVLLSLFLARTIVQPLRMLVRAAVRVRLGREREVVVPRLPDRSDEIGLLARATSDMTSALRQRIDAVEAFAADVAHEIKNPLASLRSALESLERVEQPGLRRQLSEIAAHDVRRIDRLVTEIADASRIDAELSRTQFARVDLARLVSKTLAARAMREADGTCRVQASIEDDSGPDDSGPEDSGWLVEGDESRLERVLENLLDNAVSFSPENGRIDISLARSDDHITLSVSDEGPGIPLEAREKVFERFHSIRPSREDFGRHSGLGLAIARTIAEAHDGTLAASDRSDGQRGARLLMQLPAWEEEED